MNAVLRSWSPTQMRSPVAIEEGHQLSIRILERLQDLLTSHVQQVVDKIKASAFRHGSTATATGPVGLAFSLMLSGHLRHLGLKKSMECKRGKARNYPIARRKRCLSPHGFPARWMPRYHSHANGWCHLGHVAVERSWHRSNC